MSAHIDIRTKVINLIRDDSGKLITYVTTKWVANHAYLVGNRIRPVTYLGITFRCSVAGTSGGTEPAWNTNAGDTTVDGTATFVEDTDDIDRCINSALDIFSQHLPDVAVTAVTGNGTGLYFVPTTWVNEFSFITDIEYPINRIPPSYLDKEMYDVFKDTDGKYNIRMYTLTPSASDSFRVSHTIVRKSITIPFSYIEAFCWLAISLCFNQLANAYIQVTESSISVDRVNFGAIAVNYANRATMYMTLYQKYMGVSEQNNSPISHIGKVASSYPFGIERLTHPRIEKVTRTPFNTR